MTRQYRKAAFAAGVLLIASMFLPLLQAQAAIVPSQCNVSTSGGGQTTSFSWNSGLTTVSQSISLSTCNVLSSMFIFAFFYSVPAGSPAFQPTVTDNASDTYTNEVSAQFTRCTTASLPGSCKTPYNSEMFIFAMTFNTAAAAAGHLQVSISPAAGGNFPYTSTGGMQWEFWQNVNPQMAQACYGQYATDPTGVSTFYTTLSNNLPTASCNIQIPANGIAYSFVLYTSSGSGPIVLNQIGGLQYDAHASNGIGIDTNHCATGTYANSICSIQGGAIINGPSQTTNVVGYACVSNCASQSMTILVVSFGGSITSSGTNGSNIICNPACSNQGTVNSSSTTYLVGGSSSPVMYYYVAQNGINLAGNVYDFTSEVSAVHCTKARCYLWATIYTATVNGQQPGPGNLLVQSSWTEIFVLNNGTTNKVLDVAPNLQIASGEYWAVAIFSNSTASRGSGASGSGVAVYGATWSNQMYGYTLASSTFPTSFNAGGSATNPPLYFVASLQFTVSFVTVTTTATIGGTATTTVTSTVSTIDAGVLLSNNENWALIFLFLFLPTGLLLGVTKNLSGGIIGLIIGALICLGAQIIPGYIFTGLVIICVSLLFVIQRVGSNG